MVELASIGRISALVSEKNNIIVALDMFSRGARIAAFGLDPPSADYDGPSPAVSVTAKYMNYPPAMVTSIQQMLQTRLNQIQEQLQEMGVTGIDQMTPRNLATAPPQWGAGTAPPGAPQQGAPQFVGPKK